MKELKYDIREFKGGYRVYVGNGKYRKAKTRAALEKIVSELKMAIAIRGKELAQLPATVLAEIVKQHNRCEEVGTSLEEATNHWLPIFKAKTKSLPLRDAVDEYLADAKSRLKPPTLRDKRQRLNAWVDAKVNADLKVIEACKKKAIQDYLNTERENTSDRNHKNIWAVISAFCTWCVRQDFLVENPCANIEKYTRGSNDEISVFLPKQVSSLLKIAMENYDREVLGYLVLSLFAGLRPHEFITQDKVGVWHHLEWKAIGRNVGTEVVKGRKLGKTNRARRIPVGTALSAWLHYICDRESGKLSGPVVSDYAFYQRFRRWKRAHVPETLVIEKDVLRHSFGTYRVIELKSISEVALEMGNSEGTIRSHYLNGERSVKEAKKFWNLTPVEVMKK